MADIVTTCGAIAAALVADTTIDAYVKAQFGSTAKLTAYVGIDEQNLPPDSLVPWVSITPTSSGTASEWNHTDESLTIAIAVKEQTITAAGNVVTHAGYAKLHGLCDLIYRKVCIGAASLLQDITGSVQAPAYGHAHPYFYASWTVQIGQATS